MQSNDSSPPGTIGEIGERGLITEISRLAGRARPPVKTGIGDDAALITISPGYDLVASCDNVPEDLFAWARGLISPAELGEYAVRVNISDLASMGATPIALLWMVRAPSSTPVRDFLSLAGGFIRAARRYRAALAGGDTKESRMLSIGATALGELQPSRALTRGSARRGDAVFCSGSLGLPSAAITYFARWDRHTGPLGAREVATLRRSLWSPEPRVALGVQLAADGACTSCIDNTDGVGRSLLELAKSSACELEIDEERLPLHPLVRKVAQLVGRSPVELTFAMGLDLNLIGTLAPHRPVPDSVTVIGRVTRGRGVIVRNGRGSRIEYDNGNTFEHFGIPFAERAARMVDGMET
ncbi:MAG: Thiamine-monophosphate kinase [Gemmatimonadetes bacterium]|nr:Thiamine-monophosphate kinase [Gemmatimonadota bacterium]